MAKYLALLRGINVGGNNMIKMAELKVCFEAMGLTNVTTYIQSGNIVFTSDEKNEQELAKKIEASLHQTFHLPVVAVVISYERYRRIVQAIPRGWGQDPDWKYNVLFLIPPFVIGDVVKTIGVLKPDIETLTAGDGVLYQSVLFKVFGRSTTGKIASNPTYKQMTIRNLNTTRKLLELMEKDEEKNT